MPLLQRLFKDHLHDVARVKSCNGGEYGPHLLCEFNLPGSRKQGQILALGHSDTVYPIGTLERMPFREKNGRLWGPGVFDMKGGIAMFVYAMRALKELDIPVARKVVLQLNSDEEIGSPSSRDLTEKEARRSVAVLVLEPSAGLDGKAKTGRKGVGDYTVTVRGKAAHAGLDFTAGASAIVELARQIEMIAGFTDLDRGLTVNPGVISGGTRTNVVAETAQVAVDFRISRLKDATALHRKFLKLKAFDKRCSINVTGGLNRPPLERTPAVIALFKKAKALASEHGSDFRRNQRRRRIGWQFHGRIRCADSRWDRRRRRRRAHAGGKYSGGSNCRSDSAAGETCCEPLEPTRKLLLEWISGGNLWV